jgi:hypothetical protein
MYRLIYKWLNAWINDYINVDIHYRGATNEANAEDEHEMV